MPTNPVPSSPRVPGSGTGVVVMTKSPLATLMPLARVPVNVTRLIVPEPFELVTSPVNVKVPPGCIVHVPDPNVPEKTVPLGTPITEPFKVTVKLPPAPVVPLLAELPLVKAPVVNVTVPRLLPAMPP
jgi:hypothetical protein